MIQFAITLNHITVAYNNQPVVWDVTATIPQGVMCAIMGPNGAGKSTLLKTMVGLLSPTAGTIQILGGNFADNRLNVAYVPQRSSIDWDFPINVFDVVLMGRYGHIGWFSKPQAHDLDAVWNALDQVGLVPFAQHHISALSCGQQQRVFLARALAQDAQVYLLDEPFAGIDATTEKTIVQVLKNLCARGKTVIMVHHDLQTAHEYFNWLVLLNKKLIACGPLATTLHEQTLYTTYGKHFKSPTVP